MTLIQGENKDNSDLVSFSSRSTTKAERKDAQLDFKDMTVDFTLHRPHAFLTRKHHCDILSTSRGLVQFNWENEVKISRQLISFRALKIENNLDYWIDLKFAGGW